MVPAPGRYSCQHCRREWRACWCARIIIHHSLAGQAVLYMRTCVSIVVRRGVSWYVRYSTALYLLLLRAEQLGITHTALGCCVDMPPPPPPPRPTAQTVLVHAVLCFVRPAPRQPRYVTMGGKASPLVGHLPHCMAWRTWRLGPPRPFTTPLSKKSTVISHIPSTPVVRDTCSDCSTILPTSRPRKQATKTASWWATETSRAFC